MSDTVTVNEIFFSIQGEGDRMGWPCIFVRLSFCNLRCAWCDSEYTFYEGKEMSLDEVLDAIRGYPCRLVELTGGEPLVQEGAIPLMKKLCDAGYEVSLETSGALDIAPVDARVARIVDVKTPASGEMERNHWANLAVLTPRDELKFVLVDAADYAWAKACLHEHRLAARCSVLFSAAHGQLSPRQLAEWILADGLPVRLQVQLHKLLWGEVPGR
jgi:7-carboxy-7-deazaguanine synthase